MQCNVLCVTERKTINNKLERSTNPVRYYAAFNAPPLQRQVPMVMRIATRVPTCPRLESVVLNSHQNDTQDVSQTVSQSVRCSIA